MPVSGTEPFLHVVANLYAVPTPLPNSKIEDFFDLGLKATRVRGKTLNETNGKNTADQYSKSIFAHEVVETQADRINFVGFVPLLNNLVAAIKAHAAHPPLSR